MIGTVTSRLTTITRQFLWGSKFILAAKVAWKDICLLTEEGGLGCGIWIAGTHPSMQRSYGISMPRRTLCGSNGCTGRLSKKPISGRRPRSKSQSPLIKHLISIRDEMEGRVPRQEVERLLTQWSCAKGTQEAYDWFRSHGERRFWAKFVWRDLIPPKHSFICWLALWERLTTRDRVTWTYTEKSCAFCSTHDETIEHLFFKCVKTKKVWEEIRSWIGLLRQSTTIKSAIRWIARYKMGSTIVQKARRLGLMATVYFIWKARNAQIKDGKKFDAARTIFLIKSATYSLLYSRYPDEQVIQHLPDMRSQN